MFRTRRSAPRGRVPAVPRREWLLALGLVACPARSRFASSAARGPSGPEVTRREQGRWRRPAMRPRRPRSRLPGILAVHLQPPGGPCCATTHARRAVRLMGDVPMFVAHDSVDVGQPAHVLLGRARSPHGQAGVPPDYFIEDGQLWGNPLYRWDVMQRDGYGWWIDRFAPESSLRFDAVRLGSFRRLPSLLGGGHGRERDGKK